MDPIDDALGHLRVTGSMVGRMLVAPPWGVDVDADYPCVLAAVVRGSMWVRLGDDEPVHVDQGGVVVAEGGRTLQLGDRPGALVDVVVTDRDVCFDPATGADLSEPCRIRGRTFGDPDGSVSVLIGAYRAEGETFAMLSADLPSLLVLCANDDVTPVLDVIAAETAGTRPGQKVAVDRMMELLAIAAIRRWLDEHPEVPAWANALDDPVVGPALLAIQNDPAHPWTVASLATQAGVSRATFARRFTSRVGVPPLTHLSRWRMAMATDLMRASPTLGLGEVAARVGYGDQFGFSSAYRRIRGVSPSRARRASGLRELAATGE